VALLDAADTANARRTFDRAPARDDGGGCEVIAAHVRRELKGRLRAIRPEYWRGRACAADTKVAK
jgi:hypothetical protein